MKPIVTSHELQAELLKTQEQVFTIDTGFPSLDRMLKGVEAGELVIVTGPTGEGKTTLLLSITANMARVGIGTTWFTLEVTPRQFINKITKASGTLPLFYLPSTTYDDIDPALLRAWESKHHRKFEMIDWIEHKTKQAIERGKEDGMPIKAVFIDHIHQIFNLSRVESNISLELGEMVSKVKDMAIKNDIVVFLIAHTKDDPQGTAREPRKEDIRDSGLVVRLADTVIGVWRTPNGDDSPRRKELKETDNEAKVRIFKNRREGTVGTFRAVHKDHGLVELDDYNGL